jgi:hypothetical protein
MFRRSIPIHLLEEFVAEAPARRKMRSGRSSIRYWTSELTLSCLMTNAVVKTRPDYRVEVPVDARGGYRRARVSTRPKSFGVESPSLIVDAPVARPKAPKLLATVHRVASTCAI